jgi:Auxin binding protein
MPIVENSSLENFNLPGLSHRTFAGPEHGMKNLEVWGQVIEAGAATPVHRHACEEAIVVLEGSGTLTIRGREYQFRSQLHSDHPRRQCSPSHQQRRQEGGCYRRAQHGPGESAAPGQSADASALAGGEIGTSSRLGETRVEYSYSSSSFASCCRCSIGSPKIIELARARLKYRCAGCSHVKPIPP